MRPRNRLTISYLMAVAVPPLRAPASGKTLMTRHARDFSWHLLALAILIAGFSVLGPLSWREAHQRHARFHAEEGFGKPSERPARGHSTNVTIEELPVPEPQLAPLRPIIADQIDLDPSIYETPALPAPRAP